MVINKIDTYLVVCTLYFIILCFQELDAYLIIKIQEIQDICVD